MAGPRGARGAHRLREVNRGEAIVLLGARGALSRAALARELGVSPTTASSVVTELIEAGLVREESTPVQGQRGRPARLVRLSTPPGVVVGVDIGRRHARIAVARRDETILAEEYVPVPVGQEREQTTRVVRERVDELLERTGHGYADLRAVGLGLPGPIEQQTNLIATGTILPEWVGYDVVAVLGEELGAPVALDNDANLGILGEWRHGAAKGFSDAVYVKVSTGIGSGLLLSGTIHRGAGGTAGELGHTPIEPEGTVCRCGSRGCLETVASVPSLLAMLTPTLGEEITLQDVLTLAAGGNRACLRAITDVGRNVGRGLAVLCNLLNPAVIVIGGPLVTVGSPFFDAVRDTVVRSTIPANGSEVSVRPAGLDHRSELVGAVALAARTATEADDADGGHEQVSLFSRKLTKHRSGAQE